MKLQHFLKKFLIVFFAIVGSVLIARIWISFPSLWLPIPESSWKAISKLLSVQNQEDIANVEFAIYFLISLIIFSIIWLGITVYLRKK